MPGTQYVQPMSVERKKEGEERRGESKERREGWRERVISLKSCLASQVESNTAWRNLIILIWNPFIIWLKAVMPLRWTPLIFVCSALILREPISSFSHYFPSAHVLQLISSLLSLEWTLDLGLAKEISGRVSTTN